MKKTLLQLLLFCCPIFLWAQSPKPLHQQLWDRVQPCYSNFEDMDDDGGLDYDKIDDARNGYLHISGTFPSCGCECSSTVGAYRNARQEYILVQVDEASCEWAKTLSSNRKLADILPENFGISHFTATPPLIELDHPVFFLHLTIPRKGTDTKAQLELVPFGLTATEKGPIAYQYSQEGVLLPPKGGIRGIAKNIQDPQTLQYMLEGSFNRIVPKDLALLTDEIGEDDLSYDSLEEIQASLQELKYRYDLYSSLAYTEITFSWNRQLSRFEIKDKGTPPVSMSFQQFLVEMTYWMLVC